MTPSSQTKFTREEFFAALASRHGAENQARLQDGRVGIAGLGGLGSAVALHLARLGVGTLVLADFDTVDITNLHRQQYSTAQLGMPKTEALAQQIRAVNPFIELVLYQTKVTPENLLEIFEGCTVICEAFDAPDQKAMLIEGALAQLPETLVVCASGMAGLGSANTISTTKAFDRLYVCGDRKSDVEKEGSLVSPRVGVCAGHQANMALRLILGMTEP